MTRTGRTLGEYMDMGAAGVVALISFINHLPPDAALRQSLNPSDEYGEWYSTKKTNAILADIFDLYVHAHAKKGATVTPYPRPVGKKTMGKGAIPVSEFWAWWNREEGGDVNG